MTAIAIPADLEGVLNKAWKRAEKIEGYLAENEARFLGMLAACVPGNGPIVEIGSFKGRSTVMLATVAAHYGLGKIVAIDPHNSDILLDRQANPQASSYQQFLESIRSASVADQVEPLVQDSKEAAKTWQGPIRLLWVDGDHSYDGAKSDIQEFTRHLDPLGVVAIHDALNVFPGPIRIFVEDILHSDRYGSAGFVHSIAWAQFRPEDGSAFRKRRESLARRASRLIPFVKNGEALEGMRKRQYKFWRYLVPHAAVNAGEWAKSVTVK